MSHCLCVCVCAFVTHELISRYLPVLLSLFLLVFFLPFLIYPFLIIIFSFHFILNPSIITAHCHKKHNPNMTTQINGKVGFFALFPPNAVAWQTGAVLRQHVARRLRPVPASLRTQTLQCNLCTHPHLLLTYCEMSMSWNVNNVLFAQICMYNQERMWHLIGTVEKEIIFCVFFANSYQSISGRKQWPQVVRSTWLHDVDDDAWCKLNRHETAYLNLLIWWNMSNNLWDSGYIQ